MEPLLLKLQWLVEVTASTTHAHLKTIISTEWIDGLAFRLILHFVPRDPNAQAAAKAGKWWGAITPTPESAQKALDKGARLLACAFDHSLLVEGFNSAYREFRQIAIR